MTAALAIQALATTFATPGGLVRAVDGIDLELRPGEVLGLVGESGSGKSVTLRSLVRLVRAPGRVEGRVLWQGRDLLAMPEKALQDVRGKEIAMIFQEPMTALNPVLTVHQQIDENLKAHTDRIDFVTHQACSSISRTLIVSSENGLRSAPNRPRASMPIRTSSPAACASG